MACLNPCAPPAGADAAARARICDAPLPHDAPPHPVQQIGGVQRSPHSGLPDPLGVTPQPLTPTFLGTAQPQPCSPCRLLASR